MRGYHLLSYSLVTPCYYCERKNDCKDSEKIQNAVNEIHQSTDGSHLGAGQIIVSCVKTVSTLK